MPDDDDFAVSPPIPQPTKDKPIIELETTEYGKFVEKLTGQPVQTILVLCGSTFQKTIQEHVVERFQVSAGSLVKFDTAAAIKNAQGIAAAKLTEQAEAKGSQVHCVRTKAAKCEREIDIGKILYSTSSSWEYTVRPFIEEGTANTFLEIYIVDVTASATVKFQAKRWLMDRCKDRAKCANRAT